MSSYRLTDERYLAALKRQRDRIAKGLPLVVSDSTTPGDHYTDCAWGLCSMSPTVWPDAEDHLFPEAFLEDGRIQPKHRAPGQLCPLDVHPARNPGVRGAGGPRVVGDQPDPMGCFYTCRMFQAGRTGFPRRPTRKETLALYDAEIARAEGALRTKETKP